MKDLQSQLRAALGGSALPPGNPAAPAPAAPDPSSHLLSDEGHLGSTWLALLQETLRKYPGPEELKVKPALGQARMTSDRLFKRLKKEGKNREAKALEEARDRFEGERTTAAWKRIKSLLEDRQISEKAYRSLKQEEGRDPVATLRALEKADPATIQGASPERLRAALPIVKS